MSKETGKRVAASAAIAGLIGYAVGILTGLFAGYIQSSQVLISFLFH